MKKKLVIILSYFITIICIGQTNFEMKLEASEIYKNADNELNEVYQKIIEEYSYDTIFIEALRKAQRNWIKFRDSEINMKYPERTRNWYGSFHRTCVLYDLTEITRKRTETLNLWLIGIPEGDMCSGSIKMTN
tara:strand:+ start:696 stop:1094 length:399 start_codon:yes stop_codon:yes gene_type:complete